MLRFHEYGLGAALVAGTWFWLFSAKIPTGLRIQLVAGLMAGVGTVYFLDRLWDLQRNSGRRSNFLPDLTLGTSLVPAAGACGLVAVIPWNSGGVPAERLAGLIAVCFLATLSYYALRLSFPQWQRGRALMVSLIFCGGTAGPAAAWNGKAPEASHIAFFLLLWLNATICLDPGRLARRNHKLRSETPREEGWDKAGEELREGCMGSYRPNCDSSPTQSQPASRKSQQMACDFCGLVNRTGQLALLAASVFFLSSTNNPGIQLAGGMAAVALGIIAALQRTSSHSLRAALADMALWIPALLAVVLP